MKKMIILKKDFWITFFKSFGCLAVLLIGFNIWLFIKEPIAIAFVLLTMCYYFLGFLTCYQETKKD